MAARTSSGTDGADRFDRLLHEIDALIEADEQSDRRLGGAWKTFAEISAAAHANAWDAYSVDLGVDAESYRNLEREQKEALLRVFGTIYRAESVVDDWMGRIVAAIPREPRGSERPDGLGFDAMRAALQSQEHDEKMHRGSLVRIATEVLGIPAADVERVARRYDNFVAETLFARFDEQMRQLLRPRRPLEDVYAAIFIYGVLSEDVVANSDVVIRRAKGRAIYDGYNLPGMKEGQTNVRRDEGRHVRIAVLCTRRYLAEHADASARLQSITAEYLDMADRLLRDAKRSHGVIDAHLRESYGPDVDSLYYYVTNLKRLAVRLDELGLRDSLLDVRRRVEAAVAEYTDDERRPIVDTPNVIVRTLGPRILKLAAAGRNQ